MTESIIVAILALFGTLAGSFFSNAKTMAVMDERMSGVKKDITALSQEVKEHNDLIGRMDERTKDFKEDIDKLSQRVEKHNNLIERMVCVEASTKSAHKRIDEIKKTGDN